MRRILLVPLDEPRVSPWADVRRVKLALAVRGLTLVDVGEHWVDTLTARLEPF